MAGAVRHEGITWPMCESVAQHTNAFGPYLRSMRNNQRQLRKGISDGCEEDGLEDRGSNALSGVIAGDERERTESGALQ